jgi:hypothetical protein
MVVSILLTKEILLTEWVEGCKLSEPAQQQGLDEWRPALWAGGKRKMLRPKQVKKRKRMSAKRNRTGMGEEKQGEVEIENFPGWLKEREKKKG